MTVGFEEHALEFGVTNSSQIRHGFVVMADQIFVGGISGLQYFNWFYITDLWLEKPYRKKGIGAELIHKLENGLVFAGVKNIYTWTAGYKAAPFYQKQGYKIFCELENYYPGGYNRIGLWKTL